MSTQPQGPWTQYATKPPEPAPKPQPSGPWTQYQAPPLDHKQAQNASDALIYSHMTGAPPSYTYENHDAIEQDFGTRLGQYAKAGLKGVMQDSIIGEMIHGKVGGPLESDDEISKFVEGLGQMAGDIPSYLVGAGLGAVAGGLAGTVEAPIVGTISGGVVGAGAGGFALTEGLRKWLVDKYAGKKVSSFEEVMDVVKAAGKGALTGAAFGAAGEAAPLAEGVVGKVFGERAYKAAAELATMTTVGSLVEGKVPTARDFATNAALLGVMHIGMKGIDFAKESLPRVQEKTMDMYASSGVHPAEVASEAAQRSVDTPPTDNPMEILHQIDSEIARIQPDPEAEGGKPSEESPAKPSTPPAASSSGETGIKNETTDAERAQRGLDPVEVEARKGNEAVYDAAREAVDTGKIDPRALAEELAKNPRPHTDEEAAALTYDRKRLQNEHQNVMDGIEDAQAKGDTDRVAREKERLTKIEDAINNNDEAARKSGSETGAALNARRMMIKEDYSLSNLLQRARVAGDGKVSPELRGRLEDLSNQLDQANKRIDEYEEQKKQSSAQEAVDRIKRQDERAQRAGKRAATKEQLKSEREVLYKKLNAELMQNISANPVFNPKLYELFGKLAANHIRDGITTIDGVVDAIHSQIQEHGYSKKEIRDAILQHLKGDSETDIKAELKEAKQQLKENPKDQNETQLKAYKTRLTKRIAELEKQLETGDFTRPAKKTTILDQQAQDLKAQAEKLKGQVDDAIAKHKYENMSPAEKGAAGFQKWRRAVLLSSVGTLGKLTTAAMARFGTTPIEELIGGVLSKLPGISDIAAKAPREGGLNLSAEAKAFGQFFEKATYQDIRETVKAGKSSLDYLYGKKGTQPSTALDFFGHLHAAIKVLPKRAEFFRSVEKRAQWALDNHLDIQDPKVQATIAADAYVDAQRAVFMQENFINSAFRMAMNYFHSQGLSGKATEFMIQTVLPIVKVPTNIVGELGTYATGSVTGSIRAMEVLFKSGGLDNLKMHEADNILRSLKKGSVGLAVLAMGYYAGQAGGLIEAGGFYQQGDEKKKIKPESLNIGGVELPPWLQHTPVGMVFELGATIKRVNDAYTVKGKSGGFVAGAAAGALGAVKKVPFVDQAARATEAMRSADSAGLFIDDLISSLLVPPDVRKIAEMTDDKKRKATNLPETIEKSIPGLRENVPEAGKKTKKRSIRGGGFK